MKLHTSAPAIVICCLSCFGTTHVHGQGDSIQGIDLPEGDRHVLDLGELLSTDEEQLIQAVAADLYQQKQTHLFVVTIQSMRTHWPHGDIRIETFAHLLFDQWGIGSELKNDGILLLVSKGDRKARIQLGAWYGRAYDQQSLVIMNRTIIPQFKRGRFADGIQGGAKALSDMAQGPAPATPTRQSTSSPAPLKPVPVRRTGPDMTLIIVGLVIAFIVIVTLAIIISFSRNKDYQRLNSELYQREEDKDGRVMPRGRSRMGFWEGLFIGRAFSNQSRSPLSGGSGHSSWGSGWGGGGGFGGGGFSGGGGGGFSGGGGASGGW